MKKTEELEVRLVLRAGSSPFDINAADAEAWNTTELRKLAVGIGELGYDIHSLRYHYIKVKAGA